ncbi:hypothetical protein AK812_SmicGene33233 [Symbiodinium microadriaticum]|uniref:Uncharacterized protein n=1 Tax=Symbiodinium microadriaticum TaxID=2951 RepID=A0A1Q9CS39_SYMMI|nr:hypothetical protein AK812_SmicGene33233 [Symbiodinium microadriaticum]
MPGRTASLPKSLLRCDAQKKSESVKCTAHRARSCAIEHLTLYRRGLGGKLGQKLLGALQLEPEAPTAELQKVSLSELQRLVGEQSAAFVHRLCRGEDSDEVRAGEMKRKQFLSFKSLSPAAESILIVIQCFNHA